MSFTILRRRIDCRPAAILLLAIALAACKAVQPAGPTITTETRGDTTVVRISGDIPAFRLGEELRIGKLEGADGYTFGEIDGMAVADDGTMFVLDVQELAVRVFDASGVFLRRIGRAGAGPGEFGQPSGIVLLPGGELVVRDPGNARMNVYSQAGESLAGWSIPAGYFTNVPPHTDHAGNVYTDVIVARMPDGGFTLGLMRLNGEGAVTDTLSYPLQDYVVPSLRATRVSGPSRSTTRSAVPFWPQAVTTLNPAGDFVGGVADRYVIHTWRGNGTVQRIERDAAPVPVAPAEAETRVEQITRNMRRMQEDWRWDAPQPPSTKPAYKAIRTGTDGRIWVHVSQPGERQPPPASARPSASGLPPLERWTERMVYDVFEADGAPVGTVRFPPRFTPMVFNGDQVWGVIRDDDDVDYVVRSRLVPVADPAEG